MFSESFGMYGMVTVPFALGRSLVDLVDFGRGFRVHAGWLHLVRASFTVVSSCSLSSGLVTILLMRCLNVEIMPIFCFMWWFEFQSRY